MKINVKNKYKNISQNQNVTFAIRPEQIFLNQNKDNNSFSTNVDRVEFKGAVTNIILNFPKNIKIKVQINNAEQQIAINENDQFNIYFDPNFEICLLMTNIINYFQSSIWTIVSFIMVTIIILIPLLSFLSYSFFTVDNVEIIHEFSLYNFKEFLTGEIYIPTFFRTLLLALTVMIACMITGYPIAYFLAMYAHRSKYFILLILIIPLFMSYIIKIYMMRSILGYSGLINKLLMMFGIISEPSEFFLYNQNAVIITLIIILLPLIIIPTFTSLEKYREI